MSKKEFIFNELEYLGQIQYNKYLGLTERISQLYNGQGSEEDVPGILEDLTQLIESRPQFIPAYELLIPLMFELKDDMEALTLEEEAIEQTLSVVLDDKGNFPESMRWGFQENRPLIRMIYEHGENCWLEGELEEAKKMYQGLLDSNPHDNIGARYSLFGLLKEMDIEDFDMQFYTEEGDLNPEMLSLFEKESRGMKEFEEFWKCVDGVEA